MSGPFDPASPPAPAAPGPQAVGGAQILDRGYRHYAGERTGSSGAMRSVSKYTMQRALGIHRKFRFKIVPILTIVISFIPAIVWVGVVVLTNQLERQAGLNDPMMGGAGRMVANQLIADYPASYGFIVLAIILFAAFVAPEVLCTDRKTGMLGLYLSSSLDRGRYLAAKAIAIGSILSIVTIGPALLLLIGYTSQGYGPDGFASWITTLLRVIGVGLAMAAFHTLIASAISSITTRRAAASATFIVLVLGTGVLIDLAVGELDGPMWLSVFDLVQLPTEFAYRAFGQPGPYTYRYPEVADAWLVYAGFFGWMVASIAIIAERYRRVEVTK